MYEIGEYVVHPGQGVCRIEDVTEDPSPCYQLMPVGERHPMRISYPVSSESRLRPVLSAEEARAIIDEYPTMEVESYSEHSGTLEEQHFKDEIRCGSCQDSVRIVKTFRERIDEVKSRNKKPPVAFDRILKLATARSLQELSVALDTTPEDVQALFQGALDAAAEEN